MGPLTRGCFDITDFVWSSLIWKLSWRRRRVAQCSFKATRLNLCSSVSVTSVPWWYHGRLSFWWGIDEVMRSYWLLYRPLIRWVEARTVMGVPGWITSREIYTKSIARWSLCHSADFKEQVILQSLFRVFCSFLSLYFFRFLSFPSLGFIWNVPLTVDL